MMTQITLITSENTVSYIGDDITSAAPIAAEVPPGTYTVRLEIGEDDIEWESEVSTSAEDVTRLQSEVDTAVQALNSPPTGDRLEAFREQKKAEVIAECKLRCRAQIDIDDQIILIRTKEDTPWPPDITTRFAEIDRIRTRAGELQQRVATMQGTDIQAFNPHQESHWLATR